MTSSGTVAAMAPPGETGSDAALVSRLRQGEADAYQALVRGYGGRLLAVTRRLLRNEEDARDAVQDTFLSAFRALDSFQGEARLSTWLHRIAVNAALMRIRARKPQHELPMDDLLPSFTEDGHTLHSAALWQEPADRRLERRQLRELVLRCIDQLPEAHRTILVLRDIEDLDTEQAAQLLDISVAAAKVRLHRARQALRALLDPHLRAPGAAAREESP